MAVRGALTGPPISRGGRREGEVRNGVRAQQSIQGQVCFHQCTGSCECGTA